MQMLSGLCHGLETCWLMRAFHHGFEYGEQLVSAAGETERLGFIMEQGYNVGRVIVQAPCG